ncbi:MAG: LuxR C-terminal-related transcriptional regulator [Bacteroidia bacterium]|nr:LuxR C-terminal-related transcriptional regulator [Bacteroidia bacterium]
MRFKTGGINKDIHLLIQNFKKIYRDTFVIFEDEFLQFVNEFKLIEFGHKTHLLTGTFIIDTQELKHVYVTGNEWFREFNMDKDCFLQKNSFNYFLSFIHPDDVNRYRLLIHKAMVLVGNLDISELKGLNYKLYFRLRHNTGKYIWFMQHGKLISIDGRGISFDIGYFMEIKDENNVNLNLQIETKNDTYVVYHDEKPHFKLPISIREWQVLSLILKGHSNKEIAEKIYLSVDTISNHRKSIIKKTQSRNILEAIYKLGLIKKII